MFEQMKNLLKSLSSGASDNSGFGPDDLKLCEAALMFHVIAADGVVTDDEKRAMQSVLQSRHNLSAEDTKRLMDEAKTADLEAIDLFSFTSVLKQKLEHSERLEIIRNLWEMVFADGELHELEDNVVWRVADLLEVENRDRVLLKQEVREEREGS